MPEFGFCDGGYRLETPYASADRTINYFTEIVEKGPRAGKKRLRQRMGMSTAYTMDESPTRGLWVDESNNRLFVVVGERLYELYDDGTPPLLQGNVGNDGRKVQMASNGDQVVIASAGNLYINSAPGVVTQINYDGSSDPVQARSVGLLDSRFVASLVNSKDVVVSDVAPNGGVWGASDLGRKEGYADNIQGLYFDSPYVWVHGFETAEVWATSTNDFPLDRVQSGFLPVGCTAEDSIAGAKGVHLWLWKDQVYMAAGTQYKVVSDSGVEEWIRKCANKELAEGHMEFFGKHTFYVLSFAEGTWVYDVSTGDWAEWLYCPEPNSNAFSRYRGRNYALCWGRHFVGDYESGVIYELSPDVCTDAGGTPLVRERTAPYIAAEDRNLTFGPLIFDVDTGVGLDGVGVDDPGYDPQMIVWLSDNRGKTFHPERRTSLGKLGEFNTLVHFRQPGSSRQGKVVRSRVTAPVKVMINNAYFREVV